MIKLRFAILLLLFAICSCQQPLNVRQNKIKKLSFATGGCFGSCPYLAIEVDSNLHYKYYGGKNSELKGYYTGKISQTLWDSINMRFEPLQSRCLDTNLQSVDDISFQSVIHFDNSIKNIERQEMELPKDVREDFFWLLNSFKKVKLEPVNDSLFFETFIQNGPPIVPPPKQSKN